MCTLSNIKKKSVNMPGNKEAFFEQAHEREFTYFGYSDLQLRTEVMSQIDVNDVDITGQVSTHYKLRVPVLGAMMNCISEDDMAKAMGEVGAGAFIHHANTPDEQLELVKSVYDHLNGIIAEPFVAMEDDTIEHVLQVLDKNNKKFKTLPVINSEGICVGLLNKACLRLFDAHTQISEAMLPFGQFETANSNTTPEQAYEKMRDKRLDVLVLLDQSRRIGGLCLVKDIVRMRNSNPEEYSLTDEGRLITFASVPTIPEEAVERTRLMSKYINVIGIDTSHGEHKHAVNTLIALKEAFPFTTFGIDFIAGNISTKETAEEIAKLEPDGIQVGQGPGQICISSDRLGFGTPQASAVYEVARSARLINPNMPIIADGGISDSADTVKAFALGATAVKVGGLIAATDETPVPVIRDENGTLCKEYWGMGSARAQQAFAAARARYGHFGPPRDVIFAEGIEKRIPLKGPVAKIINEHVLGVRISMAAQGARNIYELAENASLMRGSNKKS